MWGSREKAIQAIKQEVGINLRAATSRDLGRFFFLLLKSLKLREFFGLIDNSMHLRSGAFYRSGNPARRENVSRVSTEESMGRTQGTRPHLSEGTVPDYISDTSMDTTDSYQSQ